MATLDELNVILGADTSGLERGLAKGASRVQSFVAGATQAGTATQAAMQGIGQSALAASGRYIDATGRMREANGRFVSTATLAAEAAGNYGGTLGKTAGQMGAFATANAALASSFKQAEAERDRLEKGFGKLGNSLKDAGTGLTVGVTAPVLAFGVLSGKVGGDFESAFNRVEAATQSVGPELEALSDKAKGIALDPNLKFSATDAAGALEALAKNGLTATQILEGAADASVNLATATGGQLASAADITTDVMNNFGKKASELSSVVDNITGATIASKFGIEDYQGALSQAGAVAGQLGVKFEDFNTALSVTSSGFSSGSDAGTSFKTFLQRLVPQSKEAQTAMRKLGLSFFDAQGQMLPLRDIAGQLQKAFAGLSDQQRNEVGTQIFGADSIRTALLLAKDGTEGFDKMSESINKVNAASQGKILSQGFNGALEAFKSSLEGFQLAVAESGLLDVGTQFLQTAGQFVGALAELDPAVLKTGTVIAALAAGVGPLLFAIGSVVAAIPTLEAGLLVLTGPVGLVAAAVAAAAYLVIENWDDIVSYFTTGEGGKVFEDLADSVGKSITAITGALSRLNGAGDFGSLVSASGIVKALFEDLAGGITTVLDVITSAINTVTALFDGDWSRSLSEAGNVLEALTRPLRKLLGLVEKPVPQGSGLSDYFAGLTNTALNALPTKIDAVTAAIAKQPAVTAAAGAAVAALTEDQIKALEKLRAALKQVQDEATAGINFDPIGDKIQALASGIPNLLAAGFAPNGRVVQSFVSQLNGLEAEYDKFKARIAEKQAGDAIQGAGALSYQRPQPLATPTRLGVEDEYATGRAGLNSFQDDYNRFRSAISQPFALGAIDYANFEVSSKVIEDSTSRVVNAVTGMSNYSVGRLAEFNTAIGELFENVGPQVSTALNGIADSIGAAAGAVVSGGASIGDGLSLVFGGILQALAGFMGDFGKQLIAIGIGKLALDTLFKGPAGGPLAIAAGVGLVALAGVASALAKSSSRNLSSITGAGGSAGGGSVATPAASQVKPQELKISVEFAPVTLRQDGPSLRGVLNVDSYRTKRFN